MSARSDRKGTSLPDAKEAPLSASQAQALPGQGCEAVLRLRTVMMLRRLYSLRLPAALAFFHRAFAIWESRLRRASDMGPRRPVLAATGDAASLAPISRASWAWSCSMRA